MQTKMVASGERSLAEMALERPVAGVLPVMPGEFVRPGEFPPAPLPVAMVRLFPGMSSQVGLQMRGFGVGLGASGMRASVRRRALPAPSAPSALLRRRRRRNSVESAVEGDHEGVGRRRRRREGRVGAHREEELGELRRGGRSHERMRMVGVRRKVRMMRMRNGVRGMKMMMTIHSIAVSGHR